MAEFLLFLSLLSEHYIAKLAKKDPRSSVSNASINENRAIELARNLTRIFIQHRQALLSVSLPFDFNNEDVESRSNDTATTLDNEFSSELDRSNVTAPVIDIQDSPSLGRHIVCRSQLTPGSILIQEYPLSSAVQLKHAQNVCAHCFHAIPTPIKSTRNCSVPFRFCNDTCKNARYRNPGMYFELHTVAGYLPADMRTAIGMCLCCDAELYRPMQTHWNIELFELIRMATCSAAASVLMAINLSAYSSTQVELQEDFLVNRAEKFLCAYSRVLYNSFMISTLTKTESMLGCVDTVDHAHLGVGLYNYGSKFNHNCLPNAFVSFHGNKLVVKATEKISLGCPIEISYGPLAWKEPVGVRRKYLYNRYRFICNCNACTKETGEIHPKIGDTFSRATELCCIRSNCKGELYKTASDELECIDKSFEPAFQCIRCEFKIEGESATKLQRELLNVQKNFEQGCQMHCFETINTVLQWREIRMIPASIKLAETYDAIAKISAEMGNMIDATVYCKHSLSILVKRHGQSGSGELGREHLKYASLLFETGQLSECFKHAASALNMLQMYCSQDDPDFIEAVSLINILQEMYK